MDFIRINKLDPEPLYIQIAHCIEQAYIQGRLKPGDLLPTERLLCDLFNFSSKVPVQAYRYLSDKGIVERVTGRGSYIQGKPAQRVSIFDALAYGQDEATTHAIILKEIIAPPTEINMQDKMVGHRVITVQKGGRGVLVSHVYYSLKHFIHFIHDKEENLSLEALQKTYHHETVLSAINLSDVNASILGLVSRSAAYFMETHYVQEKNIVAIEHRIIPGNHVVWEDTLSEIRLH